VVKLVLWAQISPSKSVILNDSYIIGVFTWMVSSYLPESQI
jgi:hypothetical protein